ncbi:AAA family ATPase [Luedemannella flava]|uniref:AAA family ATPase n=1 Tax=Luedemannella flava TaxID=349316 RepID=A0ABP4YEI6_9ACTN
MTISDLQDATGDIAAEQAYVTSLYARLDGLRAVTGERLAEVLRGSGAGGTQQARSERDAAYTVYSDRLAALNAAEQGLCFGRLDLVDGGRRYIGRIGLSADADELDDDAEPPLMDWRAPAARPFYLATAAAPEGVRRRRHIRTADRRVTGLDDEVLDLAAVDPDAHTDLTGEAVLLAALGASRTGRMRDIVTTIQAEQDRVIRSSAAGVLVVQGGPGTGKTAVALHRAAYLLYTHREQLSQRGVLIVGPNTTFLRYVGHVLPSLGETGALLATIGELYPGVPATRAEPAATAGLKGRADMADVVAAAVADRQWVPEEALDVVLATGDELTLDRATCLAIRERARRNPLPHNEVRPIVARLVVDALADQVAERIGADVLSTEEMIGSSAVADILAQLGEDVDPVVDGNLLDEGDREEIRRELRDDPGVREALDRLWPRLTPRRLLSDLYASEERLAAAAPHLSDAERALLHREPDNTWSPADVPLLDEAAELLGEDDRAVRMRLALAEREERERVEFAEGALEVALGSRSIDLEDEEDPEVLMAHDLLDASRLAERHVEGEGLTVAQRAARDRRWAFGHVIVDEAQELSPMAWRLLMRRCPSRSMTLVGDVAQTGALAGSSSWERTLAPFVAARWRLAELTVNYRTPAEVMAVAADVLAALDPPGEPPRSVRDTDGEPWSLRLDAEDLAAAVPGLAARESDAVPDGRVGVLVPAARRAEFGGVDTDLESQVVVLTVEEAKGLEFDSVLVVAPDEIVAESPRGLNDLYVALTRTTRRLGVVHSGELSEPLRRLVPLTSSSHQAPALAGAVAGAGTMAR